MATQQMPAELERRISTLESAGGEGEDFDGTSWFWLIVLGIALPIVALILGWVS